MGDQKNGRKKIGRGFRQAGDVMLRRVPILFVILMLVPTAPRAHAEPGFIGQLLGSLTSGASSKSETKSEPVTENPATAEESEPLALQPTTTERSPARKRYHSSRRHRQAAPTQRSQARAEPPPAASEQRQAGPPTEESPVPGELTNNAKPTEQVLPPTDVDNVLPSTDTWPNPAPQALAPWPVEDGRAAAAQAEPAPPAQAGSRATQSEPQIAMTAEPQQISMENTEEFEPDSFLDPQRLMLGFIAAGWLTLGLLMFAFRRHLARALSALRRRRQQTRKDNIPAEVRRQPLTLILKNANDGSTVIEKVGELGARAVRVG
jgi:hypothetical protein